MVLLLLNIPWHIIPTFDSVQPTSDWSHNIHIARRMHYFSIVRTLNSHQQLLSHFSVMICLTQHWQHSEKTRH